VERGISEVVLSADEIALRIDSLAAEIDRDLAGAPVRLVGVLKGSVFFLCDLARRLRSPVSIDFVQASSYGSGTRSSGEVRILRDASPDVAGRNVLLVEDIVDTGQTLARILADLNTFEPASLKVCALLRKRIPDQPPVPVDYLGFEIENRFVVGYGLDIAEAYRNLPYVAAMEDGGQGEEE